MSTWHVNGKNGATVVSAAFLSMISVSPVHADSLRPMSQYLIVQGAIDAVSLGAGGIIDCNENGVDDAQDIVNLTSPDCNGNGVPDECEINENSIAPGGPFFCTDQCDPDCNRSGVPDVCELAGNDDNGDGIPDECGVFILCDSTENQKLTASDAAAGNVLGISVSMSGDTVVVGAFLDDCADGENCGAAYVFRFDGTNWIEQQKLAASDAAAFDRFGFSVAISGHTVVIGAPFADCAVGQGCGAAYVYRFDGTSWIEQQKLSALDGAANDAFGGSVSISGDTVVIGAILADCAVGQQCGAAYVYRFDGTTWIEQQKLTASDAAASDQFGTSAISGDTIVMGATGAHAAYVYRFDGANWFEQQKLTASDAGGLDEFGLSVSISGDTVVTGARLADCAVGQECGAAYVYRFDGTNWVEEQKLTALVARGFEEFRISVSISGDTVVIGAYLADCTVGQSCGAAYVHHFDGTNWMAQRRLTASDAAAFDWFGFSVSISGDKVVIGAPFADCAGGSTCGAAYTFDLTGDELPDSDGDAVCDDIDVCPGFDDNLDSDGDGLPDDCDFCDNSVPEECAILPPTFAPPPHDLRKNRYIAINPHGFGGFNVGKDFDIRLTLTETLVNGVTAVGSSWWANEPDANCISIVGPTQPATPPNWDACPTLHLTGCPIIPTSSYDIVSMVDGLVSFPPLAVETQAMPVDNKWWGDAVGLFNGSFWTGPQGVAGFDDVTAALKTFQNPNGINATHVSVTDLHPNRPDLGGISVHPNLKVNMDDVFQFIHAFQGAEYPGTQLQLCTDP